ncbi:MAG TPA: lipoprotein-releasing ABC transporter permease subunit [Rhizomicrobium sp.]|jgi:lipoprotein-releasing system permease protein|nr:lipoprotein-releasing ABC transporter permease subunit [Rhizomicrobium sp.]
MPNSPSATSMSSPGPFAAYEWMIALRYLRARRREGFVSVISGFSLVGIALGVATLIIVMSVMGGFRKEFLASVLGFNGHITMEAGAGPLTNFDAMTARLIKVPGVTRAAPIVDGQVLGTQNGVNTLVYVRGMRPADLKSLTTVSQSLTQGALQAFNRDTVIIGDGLAQKLGIRRGGSITLFAPQGDVTPFGPVPRTKPYLVAGTFKIGNNLYDSSFVFMPLEEAQDFFNTGAGVTGVEVMVQKPDDDIAMLPSVVAAAGPGVRPVPWQDINSAFMGAVQVESNVMFLILSLIIMVAALNIVSGLIMLVKDKSSDIAILRTMGASRGAVMRVFLIAGMSIGVTGTFLGFLLGVLFCANIDSIEQGLSALTGTSLFNPTVYFLSKIPADLDFWQVTSVVAMALTLTFLATLYPSWRAARLDPVEALRYE